MTATVLPAAVDRVVGAALYSNVERMCQLSRNLAAEQRAVWELYFMQGKPPHVCCQELGITNEQFEQRRTAVIRNLRSGLVTPSVTAGAAA